MTEVTLHPVTLHPGPRWREVVLEQVRVVGLSLRPVALVIAVVLTVGTIVIGGDILMGGPGFDSDETFPTPLVGFLVPFALWRDDKRFGPSFLWTLPVDRRQMAFAKVFAGGVWLLAALAIFALWLLGLGLLGGVGPGLTIMRIPLAPTLATYLFGNALILGLRHPLRWIFGVAGLLFLLGMLGDVISRPDDSEWQYVPGAVQYFSAVQRAAAVWQTMPAFVQWFVPILLWFGAGLATLWIAASRHRERRRS